MQHSKNRQKSPSAHHHTTLSGHIFTTEARIDNRKKNLLNSSISSTCPHNMVNFGPLTAESCWRVWGTPAIFIGFRVLAALLHGTGSGRQPNFAALNRRRHLYSAGRPSRWALAHILVFFCFFVTARRLSQSVVNLVWPSQVYHANHPPLFTTLRQVRLACFCYDLELHWSVENRRL